MSEASRRLRRSLAAAVPMVSAARTRDVLRSAFWLVPTLCVVASIGLAIGLIALDLEDR